MPLLVAFKRKDENRRMIHRDKNRMRRTVIFVVFLKQYR